MKSLKFMSHLRLARLSNWTRSCLIIKRYLAHMIDYGMKDNRNDVLFKVIDIIKDKFTLSKDQFIKEYMMYSNNLEKVKILIEKEIKDLANAQEYLKTFTAKYGLKDETNSEEMDNLNRKLKYLQKIIFISEEIMSYILKIIIIIWIYVETDTLKH